MKARLILLVLVVAVTGCASQVPIARNFPISSQKKVRSAHHWDVLADDITGQTLATMKKVQELDGKPLFISTSEESSTFGFALRNFLITRMVNRGMPVTTEKEGAVELQYETQLVRHESSRYAHVPGTFTALTAGVWVLRDLVANGSGVLPASVGLAALADYGMGQYAGGATPTELIVTSTILRDKQFVMRKSDIYYLEDADLGLFVKENSVQRPLKKLEVTDR